MIDYIVFLSRLITSPLTTIKSIKFKRKVLRQIELNNNKVDDFYFVYIGAHDGKTDSLVYDFIRRYGWKGVFVEPQEEAYKKLKSNYKGQKGLVFVKGVVSNENGTLDFYQSKHTYLSSLKPDDWFKRRNKGVAYLKRKLFGGSKKIRVRSYRLNELIKKYKIKKIDLLIIDAEGLDMDIINQIDFEKLKPSMIFFEIIYFTCERKKLRKFLMKMQKHGYKVLKDNYDAFLFLEDY